MEQGLQRDIALAEYHYFTGAPGAAAQETEPYLHSADPETGHDVADDLTTTELAVCMLAARDWNNPDIAEHLHISRATIERHLSIAMEKLGITRRNDLEKFMLK